MSKQKSKLLKQNPGKTMLDLGLEHFGLSSEIVRVDYELVLGYPKTRMTLKIVKNGRVYHRRIRGYVQVTMFDGKEGISYCSISDHFNLTEGIHRAKLQVLKEHKDKLAGNPDPDLYVLDKPDFSYTLYP